MTRDAGTQITLPTYRGTKTGYTNEQKWIIDGTEYNQGATYTLNDNVTATAKWTIKTYTVTLTVNGGSGSNSKTVDHGSTVTFTGVSPDSEHTDVGATITDVNASISGTTVTVSNVTSTKNITVTFPEIQQTYYWYIGSTQPTANNYTSIATQVTSYESEFMWTPSERAYQYALVKDNKTLQFIDPSFNVALDTSVDTDTISGYKIFKSMTKLAVTPIKIKIS